MRAKLRYLILSFLLMISLLTGCVGFPTDNVDYGDNSSVENVESVENGSVDVLVEEDEHYTSKDEVAAYIYQFGHLPDNYITKKEAKELGWDNKAGNLHEVAPGMSIGGDYFGNYEGILAEADGREYTECDIDFEGGYRNSKRIVYSNDGLIYYTEDHYESFELLYGEE